MYQKVNTANPVQNGLTSLLPKMAVATNCKQSYSENTKNQLK